MPPPLFNEQLDDPLLLDGMADFRGGANRMTAPHLLAANQFHQARNMVLDPGGNLRTRGGTVRVTLMPGCDRLAALNLDGLGTKLLGSGSNTVRHTTLFAPELTATQLSSGVIGVSTLLQGGNRGFSVSADEIWEYDGTKLYKLRYLTVALTEKGSGYTTTPYVTVTPASGETPVEAAVVVATLGQDADADKVVALNVLNPGRGYVGQPTITIQAPETGEVARATATMRVPPKGPYAVWHTNRLMVASGETLYVSDFFTPGYFAANNSLRVGGDGHPITGLKAWDNFNLLVFKGLTTWLVTTDPLLPVGQWPVERISSSVGCSASRTAVQVGADVWWLSGQGVVSVRRMAQETQREISSSISLPVADVVRRINWSAAETASAVYFDNKVLFALPLDNATTPNALLVYDTLAQIWLDEWTGLAAADMEVVVSVNGPELLLLVGGRVVRYNDARLVDDAPDVVDTLTNLIPSGARFINNVYTLTGLRAGARYRWVKPPFGEPSLINGSVTLTSSGEFTANSTGSVVLTKSSLQTAAVTIPPFGNAVASIVNFIADTAEISSQIDFRAAMFNELLTPKTLFNVEAEFTASSTAATLSFRVDEGVFQPTETFAQTGRSLLQLPFKLTTPPPKLVEPGNLSVARMRLAPAGFRYLQPRLTATKDRLSIRALKLTAFADTMVLVSK